MSSAFLSRMTKASAASLVVKSVSRSMSIQSKVLKYASRGGAITLKEEVDSLPSTPSGSQALIRFLASPVSHTDFKAIQSRHVYRLSFYFRRYFEFTNVSDFNFSGTEKASVVVEPTTVRFVKAQKVEPFGSVIGPIGTLPPLPAVGGIEGVAVVESVGPSVKTLKAGDWCVQSPCIIIIIYENFFPPGCAKAFFAGWCRRARLARGGPTRR